MIIDYNMYYVHNTYVHNSYVYQDLFYYVINWIYSTNGLFNILIASCIVMMMTTATIILWVSWVWHKLSYRDYPGIKIISWTNTIITMWIGFIISLLVCYTSLCIFDVFPVHIAIIISWILGFMVTMSFYTLIFF